MTAQFLSRIYDWYEEESYTVTRSVELNDQEVAELLTLTPESLIDYLRNHCVGRCNTVSGSKEYFIPVLVFGGLRASLQVNYYVWRNRDDEGTDHESLITGEEFDAVCSGPSSVLDVAFSLNGKRICLGQMKVLEVCNFFYGLASGDYVPELDERP
jgi:hypothetical protein